MHGFLRTLLFALFVALFVVGAPAVVLYTAGYRFNAQNGRIVRTGALGVSTTPRGARIQWGDGDEGVTSPYVYNRVMPGAYTLTISKDGYHTTTREVSVASGRSTYLNDVYLFPNMPLELLLAEDAEAVAPSQDGQRIAILRRAKHAAEVWVYDVDGGGMTLIAQITAPDGAEYSLAWTHDNRIAVLDSRHDIVEAFATGETSEGGVVLVDNGSVVEVRAEGALIAFLPSAAYTLRETDGAYAVITDARDNLYFLNTADENPILLSTRGGTYDWHRELGRLVWTDGIELNSYDASSRTARFITRQSDIILRAAWHASGSAMLVATSSGVSALTFTHGIVENSIPLAAMSVETFWMDEEGSFAYIFGTSNGERGLYRLQLK